MIRRLGHLALRVADMEKALDFYCAKLGLKRAFNLDSPSGEPWIVYLKVAEGQFIELFYGGTEPVLLTQSSIGFNHLCLEVADIQETAERMRQQGVRLDVEPKRGMDHNWQCWVRDPDGNRIEFMQLMPESPHVNC